MQRLCFQLTIRPGTGERYDDAHDRMSADLRIVYGSAGLKNWTMFRLDTLVIGYVECDGDVTEALSVVSDHPLERAFNDQLADVFVTDEAGDPVLRELIEVWHAD